MMMIVTQKVTTRNAFQTLEIIAIKTAAMMNRSRNSMVFLLLNYRNSRPIATMKTTAATGGTSTIAASVINPCVTRLLIGKGGVLCAPKPWRIQTIPGQAMRRSVLSTRYRRSLPSLQRPLEKFEKRIELRLQQSFFMNVAAAIVFTGDFHRFEPKLTLQLRTDADCWKL
jgi:hypothetical protein